MPALQPIVLVHGAWQTAATWDLTVPIVRRAGRHIVAAALTGLEGDASPLRPEVTLDTHIEDVLRQLKAHDLRDVTLVGHSYAGMIITGVAERASDRIAHLVYVDAFIPEDGQSAMQLLPQPIQKMFRDLAAADGDGWRLKGSDRQLDIWGLKEGPAREFVRARLCDFSIRCFERPLSLPAHRRTGTPARTYIACVREDYPSRPVFEPFAEKARQAGWQYHELPAGHACQAELPEELSNLLLAR